MHETRFSFISKVFKFLSEDEIPIVVDASRNWRVSYPTLALANQAPAPLYFSVAAHRVPEDGSLPRRGKQFFSSAHVFVLDDVGTKVPVPLVDPSYVLETSPGNFQYGYMIRPLKDPGAFQTGMQRLAEHQHTDKGAIDAVHLFRLPGSLHRTGFVSRLIFTDFRKRKPFETWLQEFGVHHQLPKTDTTRFRGPGRPTTPQAIAADQTYHWLQANRLITEPLNEAGWVSIECPWQHTHTLTTDASARYARYKPGACAFKCFHEGCVHRTTNDFIRWIMEEKCRAELEAAQARNKSYA